MIKIEYTMSNGLRFNEFNESSGGFSTVLEAQSKLAGHLKDHHFFTVDGNHVLVTAQIASAIIIDK